MNDLTKEEQKELKRSRQEKFVIAVVAFIILLIAWGEYRLIGISHNLPFEHSIFFLGLVNFNIILFLLLLFLIFRNVFKTFSKRQQGPLGSSLKSKLIAAFVGFSFIPTVIMFIVSVFYINNSFEKWFSQKVADVLKSSIEVSNSYYQDAKMRNYHFARLIAKDLENKTSAKKQKQLLLFFLERYKIDSIQYYQDVLTPPLTAFSEKFSHGLAPPYATVDFLRKGLDERNEASLIHPFSQGNLVRVIVPLSKKREKGALVISSYIPLSMVKKIDDISSVYKELQGATSIQYPMKSIYLIILILITLVILLGATWAGFYLAKQLTVSLYLIGKAAKRVAKGNYKPLSLSTGSPEINQLVTNFNIMARDLNESEKRIAQAERASAWQEVAKRMAHEIKNPLTPISLAAQRLERKFGQSIDDKAFLECTQMIIGQVNNLKELVNEFSQFARLPVLKLEPMSIFGPIEEVVSMFQQAHKNVQFSIVGNKEQLPSLNLDAEQFKRVLTNLIDNSIAAMVGEKQPQIRIEVEKDADVACIRLSLKDNGPGLPESLLAKVFDPYVTTKKTGSGLGLAIVKKTVEDHGGVVYYQNQESYKGACFVLEFPLQQTED